MIRRIKRAIRYAFSFLRPKWKKQTNAIWYQLRTHSNHISKMSNRIREIEDALVLVEKSSTLQNEVIKSIVKLQNKHKQDIKNLYDITNETFLEVEKGVLGNKPKRGRPRKKSLKPRT